MTNTLVVPSIRQHSLTRFLTEWDESGLMFPLDRIVLIEDNPSRQIAVEKYARLPPISHFTWEDIDVGLGPDSWIIPRRSDTVRSYGYLLAAAQGSGPDGMVMTLDDDCYPCVDRRVGGPISTIEGHRHALEGRSRWFNTLHDSKPRGIPFKNVGVRRGLVNHGLWMNVLDLDAPTQLVCGADVPEDFDYTNQVVPSGQYFPMCGMNVAWRPEATVLMYHLLMGCVDARYMPPEIKMDVISHCVTTADGLHRLPFDRFGDIWCGIIMKKIADHHGHAVSTGTPYIWHDRASDPFVNLTKEANGIRANETFWEAVDSARLPAPAPDEGPVESLARSYVCLGEHIGGHAGLASGEHGWYFRMLGEAMVIWAHRFIDD